jgi:hypothetical protein
MSIDAAANAKVQRAADGAISERGEVGGQVAVYLRDELIIDAWGGLADAAAARRALLDCCNGVVFNLRRFDGQDYVYCV